MRALLDVNVLVALLDAGHVHHAAASSWLERHIEDGWASCPFTQNGCLRVMSSEQYPRPQPVAAIAARLREATRTPLHEFWPDVFSLLDEERFDHDWLLRAQQVNEGYLLALAVKHEGVFVTLDHGVDLSLVRGATAHHLVVI